MSNERHGSRMHVLMISLDSSLLGEPHGNTVQRHLEYADRIGQLSIVAYNHYAERKTVRQYADHFTVYPTNTLPVQFPWRAYRIARQIMYDQPADVVTTQDPFATGLVGWLLKRRFGMPLDMQNHSSFFNNPRWIAERPLRNRFLHWLGRQLIQRADTHRVLTEGEKRHYVAMNFPAERIAVLPTPTHIDRFTTPCTPEALADQRAALEIAPTAPVILWVGQPAAVKQVDLLLDAYLLVRQAHPDARLVMAGDFSQRPNFVERATAEAVIFPGRVAHDDLPAYYQLATVYAHSSSYEGLGKVLIEALAAGTPVVATRSDGPCAVVDHGTTGLLVDHTPAALAGAICDLLDDPARARVMGAAGQRDMLARFDYDRMLDAIVESFRHTIEVAT